MEGADTHTQPPGLAGDEMGKDPMSAFAPVAEAEVGTVTRWYVAERTWHAKAQGEQRRGTGTPDETEAAAEVAGKDMWVPETAEARAVGSSTATPRAMAQIGMRMGDRRGRKSRTGCYRPR